MVESVVGVGELVLLRDGGARSGRQTCGDNIQNHLLRRPHQLSKCVEGVFSLLPASSQDACQDLLSPCPVVSAVAAPGLSGNHGRSHCPFSRVVGRFDSRALEKSE